MRSPMVKSHAPPPSASLDAPLPVPMPTDDHQKEAGAQSQIGRKRGTPPPPTPPQSQRLGTKTGTPQGSRLSPDQACRDPPAQCPNETRRESPPIRPPTVVCLPKAVEWIRVALIQPPLYQPPLEVRRSATWRRISPDS